MKKVIYKEREYTVRYILFEGVKVLIAPEKLLQDMGGYNGDDTWLEDDETETLDNNICFYVPDLAINICTDQFIRENYLHC